VLCTGAQLTVFAYYFCTCHLYNSLFNFTAPDHGENTCEYDVILNPPPWYSILICHMSCHEPYYLYSSSTDVIINLWKSAIIHECDSTTVRLNNVITWSRAACCSWIVFSEKIKKRSAPAAVVTCEKLLQNAFKRVIMCAILVHKTALKLNFQNALCFIFCQTRRLQLLQLAKTNLMMAARLSRSLPQRTDGGESFAAVSRDENNIVLDTDDDKDSVSGEKCWRAHRTTRRADAEEDIIICQLRKRLRAAVYTYHRVRGPRSEVPISKFPAAEGYFISTSWYRLIWHVISLLFPRKFDRVKRRRRQLSLYLCPSCSAWASRGNPFSSFARGDAGGRHQCGRLRNSHGPSTCVPIMKTWRIFTMRPAEVGNAICSFRRFPGTSTYIESAIRWRSTISS